MSEIFDSKVKAPAEPTPAEPAKKVRHRGGKKKKARLAANTEAEGGKES